MTLRPRLLASLALSATLAGCLGVGADHERLGDEAMARSDASAAPTP